MVEILKINIFLTILSLLFLNCNNQIVLKINEKMISEVQDKFLPPIIEKFKNFTIPDQMFDINVKISTLYVSILNIQFIVDNIKSEDVKVSLNPSNKAQVNISNVIGVGEFDLRTKLWPLDDTNSVKFNITKLELNADLEFMLAESRINSGKMLPSAKVTNLILDLDFDFNMSGTIWAMIADLFKDQIKTIIKNNIETGLKVSLVEKANYFISDLISNQTVYYNLTNSVDNLFFDYSLITSPYIENSNIILNSNGALVNNCNNYTDDNFKINLSNQILEDNYNIELMISGNSINNSINSLFNSKMLKFIINTDDFQEILKDSPIQFNTSSLDVFFNNLSKMFGKDKKVQNSCNITNSPILNIYKENFNLSLSLLCDFNVEHENSYENVMTFSFTTFLDAYFNLQPNGTLNATVNYLIFDNSEMISNKLEGAEIKYLEQFLDFTIDLVLPYLNEKILNNFNFNLPEIAGINLDDSIVKLEENFITLQVNPRILDQIIQSVLFNLESFLIFPSSSIKREINLENIIRFLM